MSHDVTGDAALRALRSNDLFRLTALLETENVSAGVLRELTSDDGASDLVVAHLQRRIPGASRETLASLVEVLVRLQPGGPERQLAIAELWRRLGPWTPKRSLPAWRSSEAPEVVAIEWLRTEISLDPSTLERVPSDDRLRAAIGGPSIPSWLSDLADPEAHLRALAHRTEEWLQRLACDWTCESLHAGTLLPSTAQQLLVVVARSIHAAVATRALDELTRPWSVLLPYEGISALVARRGSLALAARWKVTPPLRRCLEDEHRPAADRQLAMASYGAFAERGETDLAVSVAASDPALFGTPLLTFLRAMHRRGVFLRSTHVDGFVRVVVENHTVDCAGVAVVAFPVRHLVLAALAAAPPDDPSWSRRAAIMEALALGPQGATALPVCETLQATLAATTDPVVRRALIAALGSLDSVDAEPAVLSFLESEPAAALAALRRIGDDATLTALLRAFDVSSDRPSVVAALRPHRNEALTLAWHLSEARPAAREALKRLFQRLSPPDAIRASLGARGSAQEIALLRQMNVDAHASDYLRALAAVAGPQEVDAVSELLLRVASEVDAGETTNPAGQGDEARIIPEADRAAIGAMGRRLLGAGSIRPRALLDATSANVGTLFVSAMARGLLDRDDLTDGETFALLRALDPKVDRGVFPLLTRMLRRPEPQLRKVVVALLAQDGADVLAANLARLTAEDDIQTVRQSIEALGAMPGNAQVDVLTQGLDHPNMNIKKSAADALAHGGGPEAVPKLLYWLGTHDNPGFRTSLRAALMAILGASYAATLVTAIAGVGDDRRREKFLIEGLSGHLSLAAASSLCARQERWAEALREALLSSEISLNSATIEQLRTALHERGEAPSPPRATTTDDDRWLDRVTRFESHAYDRDEARALLSATPEARWNSVTAKPLRRLWNEWLSFVDDPDPTVRRSTWSLVTRLHSVRAADADEVLSLARRVNAHLRALADADDALFGDLSSLLDRVIPALPEPLRRRVASALRALPDRPAAADHAPFSQLLACGAIIERADVERALRESRRAPDYAASQRRVLRAAFFSDASGSATASFSRSTLERVLRGELDLDALHRTLRGSLRDVVSVMIHYFPELPDDEQRATLDLLAGRFAIGAASWRYDDARLTPPRKARGTANALSGPPSRALLQRIVHVLETGESDERTSAAAKLLAWPTDEAPRVLDAYLRGTVKLCPSPALAAPLAHVGDDELLALLDDPERALRVASLLSHVGRAAIERWAPLLLRRLDRIDDDDDALGAALRSVLGAVDGDLMMALLGPQFARGDLRWLPHVRAISAPSAELDAAVRAAAVDRRWDSAPLLRQVGGAVLPPEKKPGVPFAEGLADHRARRPATPDARPTRDALFAVASGDDIAEARRAMTLLAEHPDARLVTLLDELVGSPSPRLRLHAHRLLRSCVSRPEYLKITVRLLEDPLADVRRSAIRILSFGRHAPTVPRLVALLTDQSPVVRRTAEEALLLFGDVARRPLDVAARKARPDRADVFRRVLARLDAPAD